MKTLIFCLILIAGCLLPIHAFSETSSETRSAIEKTHSQHASRITTFHHSLNPRKRVKKQRKTILNRKAKMRNGHSCPSF